ncbi:hypothetical protein BC830DRAFT_1166664 [Chytriomyces sp. MP71]|nr:hypothetical protein BC830DRAFT_1166664 [Chytriomyces sp. MP71]
MSSGNLASFLLPAPTSTSSLTGAIATMAQFTATATIEAVALTTSTPNDTPTRVINYAKTVKWQSPATAFLFFVLSLIMTACVIRNLIYWAKTRHTKTVYVYLLLWAISRVVCFLMRGYILLDDNGTSYSLYQWTSIVLSLGFMPLAEAMSVVTIESSALVYGWPRKLAVRLDLLVKLLFITFGSCIAAFVMDFTLNQPFGSLVKDYTKDLVLREFGFNGLILLTIYTLVGSLFNLAHAPRHGHIPASLLPRFRLMMAITALQSVFILVKLIFTSYRNWNPYEARDEGLAYGLSFLPEYLFMLFYCSHQFLAVFDEIEAHERQEPEKAGALNASPSSFSSNHSDTIEEAAGPLRTGEDAAKVPAPDVALHSILTTSPGSVLESVKNSV